MCIRDRYLREVQEVVIYYRNVTIKNPDGSTQDAVGATNGSDSRRPTIGLFPRQKDWQISKCWYNRSIEIILWNTWLNG